MNNRNYSLDLWKFIYSWIVAFYHFYEQTEQKFLGGRFVVEFFFIVSGVFLFQYSERMCSGSDYQITPYVYIKKRFFRFFPWTTCAFVIAFIVLRIVVSPLESIDQLLDYLSSDIWEILLIDMSGLNNDRLPVNVPVWYISSQLIVEFIIFGCVYHWNRKFLDFAMPVSLIIGFASWRHAESTSIKIWNGITTFGTFRAWMVMCIGYYCLHAASQLKKVNFCTAGKVILSILEISLHIAVFWIIFKKKSLDYWLCSLLLLFVAVMIALSGQSITERILKTIAWIPSLGHLSFSIYLTHYSVYRLFCVKYPIEELCKHTVEYVLSVFLMAFIFHFCVNILIDTSGKIKKRIRNIMVQNTL